MDLGKNKKVLFLTDVEPGLNSFLQRKMHTKPENMLTIQSYGAEITHPYGDIMRSIIISIYQKNVEEIFVVGTESKGTVSLDIQNLLHSESKKIMDHVETMDYLFQYCIPEFSGGKASEWLNRKENITESVRKSVDIIRHHPLVPSYVKVEGFVLENGKGEFSIV